MEYIFEPCTFFWKNLTFNCQAKIQKYSYSLKICLRQMLGCLISNDPSLHCLVHFWNQFEPTHDQNSSVAVAIAVNRKKVYLLGSRSTIMNLKVLFIAIVLYLCTFCLQKVKVPKYHAKRTKNAYSTENVDLQ